MLASTELVAGRSCDGCTMCCKLPEVPELAKPKLQWCQHCDIGKGCKIYPDRPKTCREFYCHYRIHPGLDEYWKPSRSRMLVTYNQRRAWLRIHVDPSRPEAWRSEPYYSDLKKWARNALRSKQHVVVIIGENFTVVLPDRDKNLGLVAGNQTLRTVSRQGPNGLEFDVELIEER